MLLTLKAEGHLAEVEPLYRRMRELLEMGDAQSATFYMVHPDGLSAAEMRVNSVDALSFVAGYGEK